uniref:Inner centromere protein ARK-binding domain-containing protein n=1 Tax=Acanthochromis polyacanthus TaxID=80966 RepID=A0A3Q1FC88_9TELE
MNSMLSSVRSLMEMFDGKAQEFINEIDNVHMVWLEEIQQEANRMFSRDFNAEPELMPKTPSQKKNSRRKRVSVGRQEENQARRRFVMSITAFLKASLSVCSFFKLEQFEKCCAFVTACIFLPIPINQHVGRITRSVAANSPTLAPPSFRFFLKNFNYIFFCFSRSSRSTKRKAPDTVEESPTKRFSPPKKSQSAIRPNMRSFLHTVQKNQMLMMTPNSLGRTAVIKSFIKHTTPLKADPKTKERHKLEALKKKMEQEEERMKKMEEEKKRKQDELKRKRDERLKRVFEAKVKEEQREEEKKKKIEQKMAQIDEKNDKRQAEEKAKKKVTLKRLEEQEQKKKLEEEAKKKKIQQAEEEKRQLELLAKKKAEEEEQRARKLAEARKALELKREQERELERERQAAAERERVEKEKAIALQRELERAAREKEIRELEQRRKALEEKRKLEEQQRLAAKEKAFKETEAAKLKEATQRSVLNTPVGKGGGINVVDCEQSSPQSYVITPKGNNKPLITSKSLEDYGMDQNSDDSTDDESAPRKAIPSWAEGPNLQQIIMKQYFNPPDLDSFFGIVEPPKLESIFYKSKPRYFKRTSSAVWNSPPGGTK